MTPREAMENAGAVVMSRNTLIPLSLVAAIVLGAYHVGGEVKDLGTRLASIEAAQQAQAVATTALTAQVSEFREDLDRMAQETKVRTMNRWTNIQMHRWARDFARDNPTIKVPPVLDYPDVGAGAAMATGRIMLPD